MKGYSYPFHLLFFPRARHLFYDSFGGEEERIFYYRLVSLAIVMGHTNMPKGIETGKRGRTIGYLKEPYKITISYYYLLTIKYLYLGS